jgi:hypothetical protein
MANRSSIERLDLNIGIVEPFVDNDMNFPRP